MSDDTYKQMDDVKTAAEHEAIILRYIETGYVDRDDAIKKYKDFNRNHPKYFQNMIAATTICGTSAPIDKLPNDMLIWNLNDQLYFLIGKNILEENNGGR